MLKTGNLLGLTVLATFLMAVAGGSIASAQEARLTSDGPVTLIGEEPAEAGEATVKFTAFGSVLTCAGSTLVGHEIGSNPPQPIPSGATAVTLTPHFKNCLMGSLPATIDMNGCHYEVENGETGIAEGEYTGLGSVVCPVGQKVQMTVFSGASHAFRVCTISTSNAGTVGGQITNTEASGDIDMTGSLVGIKSEKAGLCGAATDENGTIHFNVTLKGVNAEGKSTAVALSH